MKRMIDTHIHVVPGVDDGSSFIDMSIMMLIQSYEQGVYKFIATPHGFSFMADGAMVHQRFDELCERVKESPFDIPLYLGSEIFMDGTNTDRVINNLGNEILPTMNGTDYVLIEFNNHINMPVAQRCLEILMDEGYKPVIAHAERYFNLTDRDIHRLVDIGCLIQINVWSILEEQDEAIKGKARQMLDNRQVTFLGSDSHGTYYRPPELTSGLEYLSNNYDEQYVDAIMRNNAEKLFELK